jgi:hypothetical protein
MSMAGVTMKTLDQKDTRTLGYFCFGTGMMCLVGQAISQGVSGPVVLTLSSYTMLGIVLIASASNAEFQRQNPWLVRFILAGMVIPACGFVLYRLWTSGLSIGTSFAAVLPPLVALALFTWYCHTHGIQTEGESQ